VGTTKEGCIRYEAGTCFMVRNVSEKYQNVGSGYSRSNVRGKCAQTIVAESYTFGRGILTPSCLLVFFKYFPSPFTGTDEYGFTG